MILLDYLIPPSLAVLPHPSKSRLCLYHYYYYMRKNRIFSVTPTCKGATRNLSNNYKFRPQNFQKLTEDRISHHFLLRFFEIPRLVSLVFAKCKPPTSRRRIFDISILPPMCLQLGNIDSVMQP